MSNLETRDAAPSTVWVEECFQYMDGDTISRRYVGSLVIPKPDPAMDKTIGYYRTSGQSVRAYAVPKPDAVEWGDSELLIGGLPPQNVVEAVELIDALGQN